MKKIISFVPSALLGAGFLLSLLTACVAAPAAQNLQSQGASTEPVATEAPVTETQAITQSALTSQSAPLPAGISAPLIDSPSIIFIKMLDEVYGWGVTETEIVSTNDGGITWYNVTPPGLTDVGYSVSTDFLDRTHAWVQAADPNNYPNGGALYRTTDGGITWASSETPFSAGDMKFVDADNGWMMAISVWARVRWRFPFFKPAMAEQHGRGPIPTTRTSKALEKACPSAA